MSVDVLVVGGGPAGAVAAVALVEAGHGVGLIDPLGVGGRLLNVEHLHDREGNPLGTLGWDRATDLAEHVLRAGVELIFGHADALAFDPTESMWRIIVDGQEHPAHAVLIATGCRPEPVPGDEHGALHGHGVSYCAVCDAGLFRGQRVAVVGGGDIAMAEAASLAAIAREVMVLVPTDQPSAAPARVAAVSSLGNVTVRVRARVLAVAVTANGAATLGATTLVLDHTDTDGQTVTRVEVGGVFGADRELPNSALVTGVARLDDEGFVITDDALGCVDLTGSPDPVAGGPDLSDVRGLFAAGDVRAGGQGDLQAAEQDGLRAAASIDAYLRAPKHHPG